MPYALRFDTFTRSDGDLTTDGWSQVTPLPVLAIVSYVVYGTQAASWNSAYWSDEDFDDIQFSQITQVDSYAEDVVVFVRGSIASPGTCYGFGCAGEVQLTKSQIEGDQVETLRLAYWGGVSQNPNINDYITITGGITTVPGSDVSNPTCRTVSFTLEKYVNGVQTVLAEYILDYGIMRAGLVIGLEANGTTLTPYLDGQRLASVVDASLTGGKIGIASYNTTYGLDNWNGGGTLDATSITDLLTTYSADTLGAGEALLTQFTMSGSGYAAGDENIVTFPSFSVTGTDGVNGSFEASVSTLTLAAYGGGSLDTDTPFVTLSAAGTLSPIASLDRSIPRIGLSASGYLSPIASLTKSIAAITVSATASQTPVATLSREIPTVGLTATAIAGIVGTLTKSIWPVEITTESSWLSGGTLEKSIPAILLQARASGTLAVLCLNTKNLGLTSYSSWGFNSMAMFDGKPIAAKSTGIYHLTDTTDDDTTISWKIRAGKIDLLNNKLRHAWLSGQMGDVLLVVEIPDGTQYEYLGEPVSDTAHELRIKVGRGIHARYVTVELQNTSDNQVQLVLDKFKLFADKGDKQR